MSLKSRFFTVLTVAGATVLLSNVGLAQDKPATTVNPNEKVERPQRGERGFGKREFGKGQFGRHGGPGMMRHGGGMRMMLHGLDLTDAQKTQIQSIMAANRPGQENREEMRNLMMAKRSGTLTTAQEERFTAIKAQGKEKARGVHEQILGVLTAEQKAKLEERKQQMQQRMQERKMNHQQKAPAATAPKVN